MHLVCFRSWWRRCVTTTTMGSSASKTARKLPTAASGATRAPRPQPSWAGARTPHPDPIVPDGVQPPREANPLGSAQGYGRAGSRENRGESFRGEMSSGEKDEAIKRDAFDPHFLNNLNKLGAVSVPDPNRPVRKPARAQQTLSHRTAELTTPTTAPPQGYLTSATLTFLLDQLKQADSSPEAVSKVYEQYGITRPADRERIDVLRRSINSPSVGERTVSITVEEGEEKIEMKAIWVEAAKAQKPRVSQ